MQLVITGEAENDLDHIAAYLDASGSAAAVAFLGDLQSALYHLVETPEACPIASRYRRKRSESVYWR